jgi:hypothetical protein
MKDPSTLKITKQETEKASPSWFRIIGFVFNLLFVLMAALLLYSLYWPPASAEPASAAPLVVNLYQPQPAPTAVPVSTEVPPPAAPVAPAVTINLYQPEPAQPLPAPACALRNPETAGQQQLIIVRQLPPSAVTGLVYHTVDCNGLPVSAPACAGLSPAGDCVTIVPRVVEGETLFLEIQTTTQGSTRVPLNLGAIYWEFTFAITEEPLP